LEDAKTGGFRGFYEVFGGIGKFSGDSEKSSATGSTESDGRE